MNPTSPEEVPISPWDDDEANRGVDILGGFRVTSIVMGERVYILVNKAYDLSSLGHAMVMEVSAQTLINVLRHVLAKEHEAGSLLGVHQALVSDGCTSHSIKPTSLLPADSTRLLYFDPEGEYSFLEKGRNLAGIEARRERTREYSVQLDELKKVVVACGFHGLNRLTDVDYRRSLADLRSSEFYSFFHVQETAVEHLPGEHDLLRLKTRGFQEFVDLEVEVDAAAMVLRATLTLARPWLTEMCKNPFALAFAFPLDVLRNFIDVMIPETIDLSKLGITDDPVAPNPDRKLVDFLIYAILELYDRQRTQARFAQRSDITAAVFSLIMTLMGRKKAETVVMPFSQINARNITAENGDVFQLEVLGSED